jgi:multidrug efflux pump subunit AcrA (membrane-fusion protein)
MSGRWNPGLAAAVVVIALSGCTEVESSDVEGYQPSKLQEVEGSDVKQVTFTAEGAERTGVRTAAVRRDGERLVVPSSSLLYDADGGTFVYTEPKPLSFLRAPVVVDHIEGERVSLAEGPAAGSRVVTTGAAEVYGSELEIAGSH